MQAITNVAALRRANFETNWGWQKKHINAIVDILKQNAMHILEIEPAPEELDLKQATDMVIRVNGGMVAVRMRRWKSTGDKYRDWTVRTRVPSGNETELHKLRNGWCDYYLYAWANADDELKEWILVDLQVVRDAGLLYEYGDDIPNGDGTYFVPVSYQKLYSARAIISSHVCIDGYWKNDTRAA